MLLRHSVVLRFGGLLLAFALLRLALGTQVVVSDNLADLALDRTLYGFCDTPSGVRLVLCGLSSTLSTTAALSLILVGVSA